MCSGVIRPQLLVSQLVKLNFKHLDLIAAEWVVVMAFLLVTWVISLLDVMTIGVFGISTLSAFFLSTRTDEPPMMHFAASYSSSMKHSSHHSIALLWQSLNGKLLLL